MVSKPQLKRFEKQDQTDQSLKTILMMKENEVKIAKKVIKSQLPYHMPRGEAGGTKSIHWYISIFIEHCSQPRAGVYQA
jgi:hypothetical protein